MKKSILLTIALIGFSAQAGQEDHLYVKNVSTKYILHVTGANRNGQAKTVKIEPYSGDTLTHSYPPFSVQAEFMDKNKEKGTGSFVTSTPKEISTSTLDKVRGKNNMALAIDASYGVGVGYISADAKKK